MSERRSLATQVWEIPTLVGGPLRICLNPLQPTEIKIQLPVEVVDAHRDIPWITIDAAAWRSLCGLRDKIRPARVKRTTP